ncbi:hypothetical protein LY76DRAFT_124619 [Colletotrichum caudatum]|nr:hypothetical protein LY76DRAFT_124619 [Colletotrichum caudatum]
MIQLPLLPRSCLAPCKLLVPSSCLLAAANYPSVRPSARPSVHVFPSILPSVSSSSDLFGAATAENLSPFRLRLTNRAFLSAVADVLFLASLSRVRPACILLCRIPSHPVASNPRFGTLRLLTSPFQPGQDRHLEFMGFSRPLKTATVPSSTTLTTPSSPFTLPT